MTGWFVVLTVGAATAVLKASGPALLGGRELPPALTRLLAYLSPALLAGLVAVTAFTTSGEFAFDARAAGLAGAALLLLLRRSVLEVVVVAAVVTALTRAFIGG